jgi:hypothetical protein
MFLQKREPLPGIGPLAGPLKAFAEFFDVDPDLVQAAALGLLPAALATGVGTDSQRPFALVIVSGLFSRLLISIFLMPALYTLVARSDDRLEV